MLKYSGIEYRHNKQWGSFAFQIDSLEEMNKTLKTQALIKKTKLGVDVLEIIDVQAIAEITPENSQQIANTIYSIVVMYCYTNKTDLKIKD